MCASSTAINYNVSRRLFCLTKEMEVITGDVPLNNNIPVVLPTRCETVLKLKDRVIELNFSLISDDSMTFSDNSLDEHTPTSNRSVNGSKYSVKLDIKKCFLTRESLMPGCGLVIEAPKILIAKKNGDSISDGESSKILQSSKFTSQKTKKSRSKKGKSVSCDICNKSFAYKATYQTHILTHRKQENTKSENTNNENNTKTENTNTRFKCDYCGNSFTKMSGVRKHMKNVHMPKKLYSCGQCLKQFRSSGGLRDHRLVWHQTGSELTCNSCSKRFASKKTLGHHLKTHPYHMDTSRELES